MHRKTPAPSARRLTLVAPLPALLALAVVGTMPSQSHPAGADTGLPATEKLRQMPLSFIENRGQMDGPVSYYVQGRDKSLYFTPDGVTFSLASEAGAPDTADSGATGAAGVSATPASRLPLRDLGGGTAPQSQRWTVKLDFLGATKAAPVAEQKTESEVSYFTGPASNWKTGVPTYSRLRYRNLWRGVDLVYQGTVSRLKYQFVVQPGADPAQVQLAYRGAQQVRLTDQGQLEVVTPVGSFTDDKPFVYQEIGGKRVEVPSRYALKAGGSDGDTFAFGFELGRYDETRPLVIDPEVLIYCGYIGGARDERPSDLAVDGSGAIYVTGWSNSTQPSFPVTVGPDLSYNGGRGFGDAWIAKVRPDGTALDYLGYIGGSGTDIGLGVAVDSSGSAYVCGATTSTQATFPVSVGPDLTYNGGTGSGDGWIAKVRPDGTSLEYCGYVGGSDNDTATKLVVDDQGQVYACGEARSKQPSFPVRVGPDLTNNGGGDGWVAKLAADGSALSFCGFIGGSGDDGAQAIGIDASRNVYVAGDVRSSHTSFPVRVGPDLTFNGGVDGWVARVRADGTTLDYCGYVGGSRNDAAYSLAVEPGGAVHLAGYVSSTQFGQVVGPDLGFNGGVDGFVGRLATDGSRFDYLGYVGGTGFDYAWKIALGPGNEPHLTGSTNSSERSFPVKGGPDLTFNGVLDAWVARVTTGGTGLDFCGYIGGRRDDYTVGLAVDGDGGVYVAGSGTSMQDTFPARVGPDVYNNKRVETWVAKVGSYAAPGPVAGRLEVTPKALKMGTVRVNRSKSIRLQLKNTGQGLLTVNVPAMVAPYSITPSGDLSILPGQTAQVTVTLQPTQRGSALAGLALTSSDPRAPLVQVPITGKAK